jgi:hypothetical protein
LRNEPQVFPSISDPVDGDIDGAVQDRIAHTFDESLKIFYWEAGTFKEVSEFYNHTTHLFVRFSPFQLSNIKVHGPNCCLIPSGNPSHLRFLSSQICQLQVSLYSKGVAQALAATQSLADRRYQTADLFPTLRTSPATWTPDAFDRDATHDDWRFSFVNRSLSPAKARNLLVMSSRFDRAALDRFASSRSWGPSQADIAGVTDPVGNNIPGKIDAGEFSNWRVQTTN